MYLILTSCTLVKLLALYMFLFHLYPKLVKLHMKCYRKMCNDQDDKEAEDSRPSPSLVPVPYMSHTDLIASKLIKKKLPVLEFGMLQSGGKEDREDSACCSICLSFIGKEQEVRLLANCRHVYHSECLDEWVDHGHVTCPLCQLKLLPPAADAHEEAGCPKGDQRDPWREERIAYLFGEDFVMESF